MAKGAAEEHRVPRRITGALECAADLVRHSFAKLGAATEKANACVVHDTTEDGEPRVRKLHGSSGQRPPRSAPRGQAVRARAMPPQAIGQRPQPSSAVCAWKPEVTRRDPSAPARGACRANLVPPQAQVAVGHRRDTALLHRHLDAIDDVTRTAQWMRSLELTPRPPTGGAARDRLETLRLRIRAQEAARASRSVRVVCEVVFVFWIAVVGQCACMQMCFALGRPSLA